MPYSAAARAPQSPGVCCLSVPAGHPHLVSLASLVAASLLVGLGAPAPAHAALEGENLDKSIHATRTSEAPVIDGRLDEAPWLAATVDDRLTQAFPRDGAAPSERTEIRILYDDRAIYVGVRALDSDPRGIVSKLARRDVEVEADFIGIAFDSRLDHASAYAFVLNAAGVQMDFQLYDDTNASYDWDAVWDGAVARDAQGWSAEWRVPLSALRFSAADEQVWGFNLLRYVSRKKERMVWSHVPQGTNADVSRWGHVDGITGIRPRRTFELRPYFAASMRTSTLEGGAVLGLDPHADREGTGEAGIDVKLGVTSSLTLDATLNPDFGQVEADPAVLNLSRFESFFPEKRPFFLEGADVFQTPIQVFYSRRIGRPPSGLGIGATVYQPDGSQRTIVRAPTALRLWTAAKLTGSVGKNLTLGVLDAVTGSERFEATDEQGGKHPLTRAPPRNYAALRARYSLGGASSVGVLATSVTWLGDDVARASADHDAHVQSVDARWAPGSGTWRADGQVVVSERVGGPSYINDDGRACTPAAPADPSCTPLTRADGTRQEAGDVGLGAFAAVDRVGRHWLWNASYRTLSPRFDVNDFGFVQQFNQHQIGAGGGYRDQEPRGPFIRRFVGGRTHLTFDWEGVMLDGEVGANASALWDSYWFTHAGLAVMLPGRYHAYETGDGAYLERLPYLTGEAAVESDGRKAVSFGLGAGGGHALGDPAWFGWNDASISFNKIPQAELSVSTGLFWESKDLRQWFYGGCEDPAGNACTVETATRNYRLALLDSGFLSLTLRGSYLFSPVLSLQLYSQLFMSQGAFHDRRVVTTTGPRPFLRRDALVFDPAFTGDTNPDDDRVGPDDAFQDTSLNVNVVLRWEVSPGSTLIGVYTRAQNAAYDLGGNRPTFKLRGLESGPTEEVLLVKFVYFYG